MHSKNDSVLFGTFDSESYWRPRDLARLPALSSSQFAVATMDELLLSLCDPDDLMISRWPIHTTLLSALLEAGLGTRRVTSVDPTRSHTQQTSVEELMIQMPELCAELKQHKQLTPYSILPETANLAHHTGHDATLPDPAVVATVNSKTYSHGIGQQLDLPGGGSVVRSVAELTSAVDRLGDTAIVKDPYGVAGRGLLPISTPGTLKTLKRVLEQQAKKGLRIELIIQACHDKALDFSGHFMIDRNKKPTWLGMQVMDNRGFSYGGISPPDPQLMDALERRGFPEVAMSVAESLAASGYWGPGCIDAMLLKNGQLIPMIEVNARHSMGLLNIELDRRVAARGEHSHLWKCDLTVPDGLGIAHLIAKLRTDNILYSGDGPGVLPLAGSALAAPRGRVHCALICDPAEVWHWRRRFFLSAADIGMIVTKADLGSPERPPFILNAVKRLATQGQTYD